MSGTGHCQDCGNPTCDRRSRRCRRCASRQPKHYTGPGLHTRHVRDLTSTEAAWVGAMVEAEGTIRCPEDLRQASLISVVNTSVETIATLLRLAGAGCILFCGVRPNRKPAWRWQLTAHNDLMALGRQIRPYLTDKRANLDALFIREMAKAARRADRQIRWEYNALAGDSGEKRTPSGIILPGR